MYVTLNSTRIRFTFIWIKVINFILKKIIACDIWYLDLDEPLCESLRGVNNTCFSVTFNVVELFIWETDLWMNLIFIVNWQKWWKCIQCKRVLNTFYLLNWQCAILENKEETFSLSLERQRYSSSKKNKKTKNKKQKNETLLFISIQIIVEKWNWYQSSWIIVYFNLMLWNFS